MQKSDAMLQHEKTIEFVLAHNPKGSNEDVMHIEVRNYVVAVAAILVVVIAAVSMMHLSQEAGDPAANLALYRNRARYAKGSWGLWFCVESDSIKFMCEVGK